VPREGWGALAAINSIRYRSTLQHRSTLFLRAVSNMASQYTTPRSTWSPPHYAPSAQRHAGPVVGLAATLLPILLLASSCLLWKFTQTWKSKARSLRWIFVGNFTIAARFPKSLLCPLGANLSLQLLATVYLGLTLHATCRGEMGTSYDVLSSQASRDEEQTV